VFEAPEADRAALSVLGAMLSDALAFDLRETRGLAYSIGASIAPWGGRMRLLVTMGTRKANLEEAIAGLRAGIAGFSPGDRAAVARAAIRPSASKRPRAQSITISRSSGTSAANCRRATRSAP